MLETTSQTYAGAFIYWSLAEFSSRSVLLAGLESLGLAKHVPEPRSTAAALRDALTEQFPGVGYDVARLANRDAFEVVEIRRQEYPAANVRTPSLLCRIDAATLEVEFAPLDWRAEQIVERYNRHRGYLRRAAVGQALVAVVHALGGTSPRPQGGLYWLPNTRLDEWRRIVQAVEASAVGKQHSIYAIHHAMDAEALRAIRDAIVEEVSADAGKILAEVNEGGLGERALEHRQSLACNLRDKVLLYEELLNVGLTGLHQVVDQAEEAAGKAALMASAMVAVA